jgi:hypothetical protein
MHDGIFEQLRNEARASITVVTYLTDQDNKMSPAFTQQLQALKPRPLPALLFKDCRKDVFRELPSTCFAVPLMSFSLTLFFRHVPRNLVQPLLQALRDPITSNDVTTLCLKELTADDALVKEFQRTHTPALLTFLSEVSDVQDKVDNRQLPNEIFIVYAMCRMDARVAERVLTLLHNVTAILEAEYRQLHALNVAIKLSRFSGAHPLALGRHVLPQGAVRENNAEITAWLDNVAVQLCALTHKGSFLKAGNGDDHEIVCVKPGYEVFLLRTFHASFAHLLASSLNSLPRGAVDDHKLHFRLRVLEV